MSSINELFVKHFENVRKALVKRPLTVRVRRVACACAPEHVGREQLRLRPHLGASASPQGLPAASRG